LAGELAIECSTQAFVPVDGESAAAEQQAIIIIDAAAERVNDVLAPAGFE
jgi:hypothetical protein